MATANRPDENRLKSITLEEYEERKPAPPLRPLRTPESMKMFEEAIAEEESGKDYTPTETSFLEDQEGGNFKEEPEILSATGKNTSEGRPVYKNQFGDFVTERTITEYIPELGGVYNIPTVLEGRFLSPPEAIDAVIKTEGKDPVTGRALTRFRSIDSAVKSAEERSGGMLSDEMGVRPTEAKEPHPLLTFLRGDLVDPETKKSFGLEGFKTKTYNPGGKSGITIGTGIDLKHHTKQSMIDKGVPEEVAEKLSPYYGKSDKSLVGQSPLTREEVEMVDEAVMAHTVEELKEDLPHFDDMPQEMQQAAVMAKHQYGKGWPTLRGLLQSKDYVGAMKELLKWEDSSKDKDGKKLGKNIERKYQALGKIAQQEYFTDFDDGVYEDPDTKERFKVRGGKRL